MSNTSPASGAVKLRGEFQGRYTDSNRQGSLGQKCRSQCTSHPVTMKTVRRSAKAVCLPRQLLVWSMYLFVQTTEYHPIGILPFYRRPIAKAFDRTQPIQSSEPRHQKSYGTLLLLYRRRIFHQE